MKNGFILLLLLVLLSAANVAYGDITCAIRAAPCPADETKLIGLSHSTNAMAETPAGMVYGFAVCCGPNSLYAIGSSPLANATLWKPLVNLSAVTNAHASVVGTPGYTERLSISSATYPMNCTYTTGDCSTLSGDNPYQCVARLSDFGNAHFGDCLLDAGTYPVSVCCSVCQDMDMNNESCVGCSASTVWNTSLFFEDNGRTTNASCCEDDSSEYFVQDFETPCSACCNQSIDTCYINESNRFECGNSYIFINGTVIEERIDLPDQFQPSAGAMVEVKWRGSLITMKRNYTNSAGFYSIKVHNVSAPRSVVFSKSGYIPVTLDFINGADYTQDAKLYLTSECRSDCSRFYEEFGTRELRCDAACEGINGCTFPQNFSVERGQWISELCDQKIRGWETHFNFTATGDEYVLECCNNQPRLKISKALELESDAKKNIFTMSSSGYTYKGKPVVIYVTTWD